MGRWRIPEMQVGSGSEGSGIHWNDRKVWRSKVRLWKTNGDNCKEKCNTPPKPVVQRRASRWGLSPSPSAVTPHPCGPRVCV